MKPLSATVGRIPVAKRRFPYVDKPSPDSKTSTNTRGNTPFTALGTFSRIIPVMGGTGSRRHLLVFKTFENGCSRRRPFTTIKLMRYKMFGTLVGGCR